MIWLILKRVGTVVITWLSHRSVLELAFMAMVAVAAIQTIRVGAEQRHSAKVERQLSKTVAQLQAISSKRNEQRQVTTERIRVVTRTIRDADGKAKAIEQAPLPGNCKTPREVLRADL